MWFFFFLNNKIIFKKGGWLTFTDFNKAIKNIFKVVTIIKSLIGVE